LSDIPEAKWEYSVNGGSGLCDIITDDIRVMQILDKLREDKAAGADELVSRFWGKIQHQLACPLTILLNNIMKSGQVPADWKEANVVPVFKGGCRNVATNYRPISLTSQLSKVLETIVRDQVVEFLEVNKLIRDSQHGFRKGSSCLTNTLLLLDKVLHSVDEGHDVDVVFLDLAKAFDKVPHKRLLEKLKKRGISGNILNVIEDWLKDRRQRVCIKGRWSGWIRVWRGVLC